VLSRDGFTLSVISTASTLACANKKSGEVELVELDLELEKLEELAELDDVELDDVELDEVELDELTLGDIGGGGAPSSRQPG